MVDALKGEIVVMPFPFSDLSQSKRRPALVLASLTGGDRVLCMISTQGAKDPSSVPLSATDLASGSLSVSTFIRPSRLFTANVSLLLYTVASLKPEKMIEVRENLYRLFS